MPPFPFEEQGAYCYANVCRYVRPSLRLPAVDQLVFDHNLKNKYHRAFMFHMLIGLGQHKNSVDFGCTRSKDKVTRVTFVIKSCPLNILKIIYHTAFVFHMLIDLGDSMTCIGLTRSLVKVTMALFVKMVSAYFS